MYNDCDADIVEGLIKGATKGLSAAIVPESTTHNEVLSAAFTFLDRTLRSVRKLQSPDDRFATASQIKDQLNALLVDHGHVPS